MSSFVPTQAELALVNQILAVADTDKLNLVTGKAAVKVFEGAKLQPHVLGEIWSISDKENNGFLTRSGLATAVRLIGHAQQGETVTTDLLDRPATTLAHIEGISKPTSRVSSIPSSPTPRSPAPRGSPLPPLTPEDKAKFARLFESCGPVQGLISGDKAYGTFVKSNLPIDKLGSIWALADTQNRGALDQTDFTIAMYLIQASMSGKLPVIPNSLPPGFYEQAGGRPSPRGILAQNTGNSSSLSPALTGNFPTVAGGSSRYSVVPLAAQTTGSIQPLQPQGTGQQYNVARQPQVHFSPQNTGSVLGASAFGHIAPPIAPQWDVTAEEKARFDKFFDGLDTSRRGVLDADVAVPFMLQSSLSQDVLAPIWDLADLNNDGSLTRDGFAIAMHLIQGKLAGKEVPATMPESLIPPSMRKGKGLSIMPPPPPEPVRDLLGDDTPPASPPVASSPPVSMISRSNIHPQQSGSLSPQSTGLANRSVITSNDPFAAAFGPPPTTSAVRRDLLSDDDDTVASTPPVPDNSVEIGNLQNQLQSTNRSLESTKADRERTEQAIASQSTQLSSLQTQLASAKAAYETETRLLNALRERFGSQASEMQKLREELIRAESDLSAIRIEKSEIEGNLMRDKEDHRALQKKMKEAGEETEHLKVAVEKAKKDTKHQKGLLAIAKKQLASREADRAKVAKELEEAEQEANETVSELQETEAQLAKEPEPVQVNGAARATSPFARMDTPSFAASMPLPSSPSPPGSVLSPASTKSNNPFERLAQSSGASTPRPASPFAVSTDVTGSQDAFSPFATSPPENTTSDVPRAASPFMHASDESKPAKPPAEVPRAASPFMHIAEASTTTAASGESAEDPFGFGDGDGDEKSSDSTGISTPDMLAGSQRADQSTESPISPEDSFQTAAMSPASSTPQVPKPEERKDTLDTIVNAAAVHFPSLDGGEFASGGGGLVDNTPDSPELSSRALEIEHDESDSDSETEEENKPIASLVKKVEAAPVKPSASPAKESSSAAISTPMDLKQDESKAATTSPAPNPELFDDAFGIKSPADKPASTTNGFDDAFGTKPATVENVTVPPQAKTSTDLLNDFFTSMGPQQPSSQDASDTSNTKAPVSGVNAFDEAMNGITPASNATQPQFKLDSAFDDNFDFAAAKADESPFTAFPAQPSSVNGFAATTSTNAFDNAFLPSVQQTGELKSPPNISNAFVASQPAPDQQASLNNSQMSNKTPTFDDAFGSLSSRTSTVPSSTGQAKTPTSFNDAFGSLSSRVSSVPSSTDHGISFDDVFGGNTAPALGDTLGLPAQAATEAKKQDTAPQAAPFQSSPPGSPSSRMPASRSSVRSTSPPPRISSPRPPRPSTGSSSDGGVPASKPPPATRHSKLSIRLPFGRKDKKKSKNEPPPPSLLGQSSTFLSPVAEPERNATPAVEDDVEPVKQLCGMGFSRSQAVTALENNGYNFQKALDSLLRATPA